MQQPPYGYPPPQGYYPPPPPPPPKKNNTGLVAVLAIIGVAVLGAIVSAAGKPKTPASSQAVATVATASTAKPTATKGEDEEGEAPIVNATPVAAATLLGDYEGNEVRGDAKWKGRAVEVTGKVRSIDKGPFGGMYVVLEGSDPYSFNTVHVEVKKSEEGKILAIDKGEKHAFRGRVLGMTLGSVSVRDSVMVK